MQSVFARRGSPVRLQVVGRAGAPDLSPYAMPSLPCSVKRAIVSGATLVTPNRRLARALVELHDGEQRAAGCQVWPAARVLPWDAWLQTLWAEALAAGVVPEPARLRTPVQAAHAWNRIVAAEGMALIDPRGAAVIAADAWTLVHAWGQGGESWRAWAGGDDALDDCATFARWASRYARELRRDEAVDLAELAERLCAWASGVPSLREAAFTFCGFTEFTPQQERLQAAIVAAGARVAREETLPREHGRIFHASGATPRDEIARALTWARTRALAHADATIAIVVEDLAARRDEIRAVADEILCPALLWPGGESVARPYNLSLGAALSEVPLAAVALDLLGWAERPLPLGRASALLRSPLVAVGPDTWIKRAQLESEWLEEGRAMISIGTAITALSRVDRPLAARWAAAIDGGPWPASASVREHADAWRARLAAFGWPGSRPLDSAEYQALGAWDEALADFATLGAIESRMARGDALAALRAHAASVVFQPESPPAPIQIVGLLEAAGQPFDALWVAGLTAERWPPAPRPNPMLPVAWQREHNVPRSSAARELAYASALTAQFARAAPEVVFSYAEREDDQACGRSRLVPGGQDLEGAFAPLPSIAQGQFAQRAPRECVPDDTAPALEAGTFVRGGAGLVEAQSDCPFKAVAMFRLGTETWPEPIDGLSARERGILVHATLAAFWRDVKRQDALNALSPAALHSVLDDSITDAINVIPAPRWRTATALVREGERARLSSLVRNWLERHERTRPPFTASAIEAELDLALGGLNLRLRVDRIDLLEGDGAAIIDYKTGRVEASNAWFEPRPPSPQLGLYTLARRAAQPEEPVRAVAYAQLKLGDLAVRGLAADAAAWPALRLPSAQRDGVADWPGAEARWREVLGRLGAEIAGGVAAVSPRDRKKTCARCCRQPLCRIGALAIEDREIVGDE